MTTAIPLQLSILLVLGAGAPDSRAFGAETEHVPSTAIPTHTPRFPDPSHHTSTVPDGKAMRESIGANAICSAKQGPQIAEVHKLVLTGRLVEAEATFQAALEGEKRSDSADPVTRACLMNMIGYAELQQRRPDVAAKWFQRGLELNSLPESLVVRLTSNLASAYVETRELDRADETGRRALRLAAHVFGSDHEETLFPQTVLAGVHVLRGDFDRAEPVCRRVLYETERKWGASSYEASVAAGNLAVIYLKQHRYTQAQVHFEKSLHGLRINQMTARDEIPVAEAGLALSYAAGGRAREADMLLEQALASAEAELGPADPAFAAILELGANARFFLKDYDSAKQLFERAIAVLETHYGPGSPPVLGGLERYAGLLRAAKDKTRARQVDERRKAFALKR
jgi:tetratricopeptide (TPR) repeat protein